MSLKIVEYVDEKSHSPFKEWLHSLRKDKVTLGRILGRIRRFENGNFGDSKSVGDGVMEHRLDFGPGYRIYYGHHGDLLVIVLGGGDKSSQDKDIKLAQKRWQRWKNENKKSS